MFTDAALFHDLAQFGGLGIVIAFLIWKDIRADRIHEKMQKEHWDEIRLMEERRLNYDKDRLSVDKETAATLAALASALRDRT